MGIDARILVRGVPQSLVSTEWLKETSWKLCQSIGAKEFFVRDGMPPEQYDAATKAWHEAFHAHRLYAEYEPLTKVSWGSPGYSEANAKSRALAERIREDIGAMPECLRLAIEPTNLRYRDEGEPPPGAVYHQDGDPIEATKGECLLQVNVYTRYYGEDYERGDILIICAIAEWLEINIPGCEVWYGGDSSGVLARPFPETRRRALRNHLYSAGGREYFNRGWMNTAPRKPPACGLCPDGRYCGSQFGSGRNDTYAAFHCAGCGKSIKTEDSGRTWTEHKDV